MNQLLTNYSSGILNVAKSYATIPAPSRGTRMVKVMNGRNNILNLKKRIKINIFQLASSSESRLVISK